jgi:hypothetical protein
MAGWWRIISSYLIVSYRIFSSGGVAAENAPVRAFLSALERARPSRRSRAVMSDAGTTSLIFGVVIGTILCDYALTLLASLLNYRALDQPLPAEFSGIYQPAAYAQSQAYTKAKSVHSLLHGSFDLGVLLLFWLVFDGFERLDLAVRAAVPGDEAHLEVGRGAAVHGDANLLPH